MRDYLKRKMTVRTNGFHNYLWSILFDDIVRLHYRIVVRDVYGKDHEIYNRDRYMTHVPSERHVYHVRYSVKVPEPILFMRLDRMDAETKNWYPISCIDFMGMYARDQFKPGRYTLFDSFRWNDIAQE